jgi:hypothetical protein
MDTAYTYTTNDSTIKHTQYRIKSGVPTTKPGHRGLIRVLVSQTTDSGAGYQIQMTSDVADCSDQAYIYVWSTRINPPSNDSYDHRALDDINTQEIDPGFAALDNIKPLSETIFHDIRVDLLRDRTTEAKHVGANYLRISLCQLMHAVGGRKRLPILI